MGVIPKANGKFRPVQDFSFPRNDAYTSINKFIESDEFITGWDGVNDAFKAINDLPNDIQGATMDAQEAFRACPARISQLPGMVVMLEEGVFYMDFFLGFGLSSATGVWGKVGDCTKAIIEGRLVGRVKVLKWVDDFLILRLDPSVTVEDVLRVTKDINFPWNPAKTIDFSDSPKYIGWVFDIARRKVILPRDKADKYKDQALPFTDGGRQSLKDTMKLLGSLQHVAYVSRDLRPWLSELSGFVAGWEQNNPFQMRHVKPEVQREAAKWVAELSLMPFVRSFARPTKVFEPKVWVDASSEWGIGVIVGDAWSAWSWTPGWDADGRNIGWAEAVALELGLRAALALGARDSLVQFFSDNQGVLFGYKLGRSRGKQVNSVLKRVVDLERDEKVRLDIRYVESANNPADGPSRGVFPSGPRLPEFKIPPLISQRTNKHTKVTEKASFGGSSEVDFAIPSAFPPPPGSGVFKEDEEHLRKTLFPRVPLSDRLLKWRPGFEIANSLTLSSGKAIPDSTHIDLAVSRALGAALEPSARENYGSGIGIFIAFCFDLGLSVRDIFPISEGLLLAFVGTRAGSKSAKTVSNHLSALAAWHESWGVEWVKSPLVGRALRGVAKLAPDKLPLRPPVQIQDLVAARTFLNPTTDPLHAATWACALMSFWSACRLGETTCPSANFFNPARHVSRSGVGPFRSPAEGAEAVGIHLPWTKTTLTTGMTKILSTQQGLLDPIQALRWHLVFNSLPSTVDSKTPLFAYKVRAGKGWRLVPLAKEKMLVTFSDALKRAGRPTFSGHSFRIGAATYYWHKGASVDDTKLLGGWVSDSFRLYLRDPVAGIAPVQQRLAQASSSRSG